MKANKLYEAQIQEQPINSNTRGAHSTIIYLQRDGYDPFIAFLKGMCIIFVIINHCIPAWLSDYSLFVVWGTPAVPIFLLIQVFHAYKKGTNKIGVNFLKLWNRIIKPFLIVQFVIISFQIIDKCLLNHYSLPLFLSETLLWGGIGPGCYYPWIYIQFALLLPLLSKIFQNNRIVLTGLLFLLLSVSIEILCSLFGMTQRLYRLLCLRFIFIIFLGYLLAHNKLHCSKLTICFSLISILATIILSWEINWEPFFYSFQYTSHHWLCYVYIVFLYLAFLKYCHQHLLDVYPKIERHIIKLGRYSYETFLFQMLYFAVFQDYINEALHLLLSNDYIIQLMAMLIAIVSCTVPIILYKNWKETTSNMKPS